MIIDSKTIVRPAENKDRNQLAHLIHFGTFVHRHLDWRPPLGWIGHQPFNILEWGEQPIAALACPPDPDEIAWLRLFVCSTHFSKPKAWDLLWPETKSQLMKLGVAIVAAIPLQKWVKELLLDRDFIHTHNVISLTWDVQEVSNYSNTEIAIRDMTTEDLLDVHRIDSLAFDPLWQNSLNLLKLAYESSNIATVAEDSSGILGYQISTPTQYGTHLGRLAVLPQAQRKGIGFSLVKQLQSEFARGNIGRISVNTQDSNVKSLALYRKAGFVETKESYPVFQFTF